MIGTGALDEVLSRIFADDLRDRFIVLVGDARATTAGEVLRGLNAAHVATAEDAADAARTEPYYHGLAVTAGDPESLLDVADHVLSLSTGTVHTALPEILRRAVEPGLLRLLGTLPDLLPVALDSTHSGLVDPVSVLRSGTAWCDQYAKVFLYLAGRLFGVPGREVAIHRDGTIHGHTVAEVYYDGAWRMYDADAAFRRVWRRPTGVLGVRDLRLMADDVVRAHEPDLVEVFSPQNRLLRFLARWDLIDSRAIAREVVLSGA